MMNSYAIGSTKDGLLFLDDTKWAGVGWTACRLQSTFMPFALASFFLISFSFTLLRKSSRQVECLTCSTLMLFLFGMILFPSFLLTMTPTALRVTLNTRPVLPW